jgi:hypothetical protein
VKVIEEYKKAVKVRRRAVETSLITIINVQDEKITEIIYLHFLNV